MATSSITANFYSLIRRLISLSDSISFRSGITATFFKTPPVSLPTFHGKRRGYPWDR